jgi:hypothetical protein
MLLFKKLLWTVVNLLCTSCDEPTLQIPLRASQDPGWRTYLQGRAGPAEGARQTHLIKINA